MQTFSDIETLLDFLLHFICVVETLPKSSILYNPFNLYMCKMCNA